MEKIKSCIKTFCDVCYKIHSGSIAAVFSVSGILMAFVINSFSTELNSKIPAPIRTLVEYRWVATYLCFSFIVFCFLMEDKGKNNSVIKSLEDQIKEKDRQAETNAGIIASKYGEFAESVRYSNIKKILTNAVNKSTILQSCTLYKYSLVKVHSDVSIKLEFVQGTVQETTDINSILQVYYKIDKDIFKDIIQLTKSDLDRNELYLKVYKISMDVLNSNMEECIKTGINTGLITYLLNKINFSLNLRRGDNITDTNKVSMLIPILLSASYLYNYNGNNAKKIGRIYCSTPIVLDKEYLINFSLDGSDTDIATVQKDLELIVSDIKKEYNRLTGDGIDG